MVVEIDKKFCKQNRNILLFIDNCTAHNSISLMENVKVIFFPPNMTSVFQPIDQGIIKNFKHCYRRLLVQNLMSGSFFDTNGKIKISVLEAARMCHNAWAQVTGKTIVNCFYKACFKKEAVKDKGIVEEDVPVPDNWEVVSQEGGVSFEELVSLDESVAICDELTDQEMLAEVTARKKTDNSSDEEEERPEVTDKPISMSSEGIDHLHELRRCVLRVKPTYVILFSKLLICFTSLHYYTESTQQDS